jgi:hypothetical protein
MTVPTPLRARPTARARAAAEPVLPERAADLPEVLSPHPAWVDAVAVGRVMEAA